MAKLTEEQMIEANKVWCGLCYDGSVIPLTDKVRKIFQAVDPCMQLPWEVPTDEEIVPIYCEQYGYRRDVISPLSVEGILRTTSGFVHLRNAALLPKPMDQRRQKVIDILDSRCPPETTPEQMADMILAAIDEVK